MRAIITFVCLTLLFACQTEKALDIAALETLVQTDPSPKNQQQLVDAYLAHETANPQDSTNIAQYLYRAAALTNRMGDAEKSFTMLPKAINWLAKTLYDPTTFRPNTVNASDFIAACELFAKIKPDHAESPANLFRAGETARSVRNFDKALQIYDHIYEKYPNYEKAPQSLFLKGFTLDNDLKKHDEARVIYELFLEKHPNDEFADDTKFLISNMGKSDDEIIKSFESKEG